MGKFFIGSSLPSEVTVLSNQFIDRFMPRANGEFVKVYLYLLRSSQGRQDLELSSIADILDCTERDVIRALRYWEKAGLVALSENNHQIEGVTFCPIPSSHPSQEEISVTAVSPLPAASPESRQEEQAEEQPPAEETSQNQPPLSVRPLSAMRKKELQKKEEVSQFLYIAERYLGRTLSKTDMDNLLYFYSELHFHADLIEYLIEYCVSKGSKSTKYIEAVALAWAAEGITTVEEAKKSSTLFHKHYFTILKAMGITGRNPVEMERKLMDSWLQDLNLSMDLILEACQRTVMQTGKPSFQYADSILKRWHKKQVTKLSDLESLDESHRQRSEKSAARGTAASSKEYPHRDYDFDEIQKALFKK